MTRDNTRRKAIQGTPLRVMEALWHDGFYGAKGGLTAAELAERLAVTAVTVNEAFHALRKRDRPLIVESVGSIGAEGTENQTPRRGKLAVPYSLNGDLVITWPSTGASVLHLFRQQNATESYEKLVQDIADKGWHDSFRGEVMGVDSIKKQISFAEKRGYIMRVPEHPDLVCIGPSALEELGYLRFIAAQMPQSGDDGNLARIREPG